MDMIVGGFNPTDYSKRECELCHKEEVMHKFDKFCKRCRRNGKNQEPQSYRISPTK